MTGAPPPLQAQSRANGSSGMAASAPLSGTFAWSSSDLCTSHHLGKSVHCLKLWWDESGAQAVRLRFEPGGLIDELPLVSCGHELFVVAGAISDHLRSYSQGTFIHVPRGNRRSWSSRDGADVIVFAHPPLRRESANGGPVFTRHESER